MEEVLYCFLFKVQNTKIDPISSPVCTVCFTTVRDKSIQSLLPSTGLARTGSTCLDYTGIKLPNPQGPATKNLTGS